MAIKCALTEPQVEFVYKLTKSAIEKKLNTDKPFDISSYMNYLYERVKKSNGSERAAQFLAEAPQEAMKLLKQSPTMKWRFFESLTSSMYVKPHKTTNMPMPMIIGPTLFENGALPIPSYHVYETPLIIASVPTTTKRKEKE